MKIHVHFEFDSVDEMQATIGERTNQVTQAITGTPAKPPALVKQEPEPDADENETEEKAPPKRAKKAAKRSTKKAAPPAEEEEGDEEEEETPRAKKTAKKGALRDLLDPADDDDDDEDADEEEEEEEAPRPKKKADKIEPKTFDEMKEACRAFAKKYGAEVLSDVLTEKYDVEALEDFKPKQYNEVIATLLFYEPPKKTRGK